MVGCPCPCWAGRRGAHPSPALPFHACVYPPTILRFCILLASFFPNKVPCLYPSTQVKAILVNIFGGIMRCDVIASGIVNAAKQVGGRTGGGGGSDSQAGGRAGRRAGGWEDGKARRWEGVRAAGAHSACCLACSPSHEPHPADGWAHMLTPCCRSQVQAGPHCAAGGGALPTLATPATYTTLSVL